MFSTSALHHDHKPPHERKKQFKDKDSSDLLIWVVSTPQACRSFNDANFETNM